MVWSSGEHVTDCLLAAAGGLAGSKEGAQFFLVGLDALGGYVFARMAHNEGMPLRPISTHPTHNLIKNSPTRITRLTCYLTPTGIDICPYNVAAAAGAVYGVITGFFHTIIGCLASCTETRTINGHFRKSNVFGTVTGYDIGGHDPHFSV